MTDPAEIHQAKRICMNRPSLDPVESRLTKSKIHPNAVNTSPIFRFGTNTVGPSWTAVHGFPLSATNQMGGLTDDSSRYYTGQLFEQLFPLNLSKKSLGSASDYSTSPDNVAVDFSTQANPSIEHTKASSHSRTNSSSHIGGVSAMNHIADSSFNFTSMHNIGRNASTSLNIFPGSSTNWSLLKNVGQESLMRKESSSFNGNLCSPCINGCDNGNVWAKSKSTISGDLPMTDRLPLKVKIEHHVNENSSPNQSSSTNRSSCTNAHTSRNGRNSLKLSTSHSPNTYRATPNVNDSSANWCVSIFDEAFIKKESMLTNGHTLTNDSSSAKKKIAIVDTAVASASIAAEETGLAVPTTAQTTSKIPTRDPVLNVLNTYLGMDGTTSSRGRSLDPKDLTVNGILFRVQEAQRLAQLLPDDPTEEDIHPIMDILERPGVEPDTDETCLITFNQNLARDLGNRPRRSIRGHMDRILNNDSARSCRIQNTATASQVSNDVFVQMKRQKALTKRWSEELTTLNYLQALMEQMGLNCDTESETDDNDEAGYLLADIKEEVNSDDEELIVD